MQNLQKNLFALIERSEDVYLILNSKREISFCSGNIETIFAYKVENILGKKLDSICFSGDKKRVTETLRNVIENKTKENGIRFRLVLADRSFRWVSCNIVNALADDSIQGLALFIRDITQTINSKLFKDSFFNLSLDLFAILDSTGKMIEINEMWSEKFGYSHDEYIKFGFSLILNAKEILAAESLYSWIKESDAPLYDYENECTTKTGEIKYISWSARSDNSLGLVFVVGRDFTEKKIAEQKLIESEARLTAIVDNTKDVIFSIDTDYRLLKFNDAFINIIEKSYGFTPKAGYSVVDPHVNTATNLRWENMYDRALKGEEIDENIEADPPFEENRFEVSLNPIRSETNSVVGVAVFMKDVTDRIKAEMEQREISNLLIEKNRDLINFSFIATHNLRAPVSNLVSLISLYDKANPASYENEEIIVNFEYSINLLNETLHDLMEAVKIRDEVNKKYEVIKFEDILSSVQWRLHPLLSEKTVKIVSDFSSMSTIYYPKVDLESIFYNFISNSVRFSSNDRECFINITSGLKDEFAILVFEDNGLGIDLERYRSRLFGLYQRFHHQNTGKGLGLYLLNTQIKSMGGTIEVESKVDIGTKFTVKIKMRKSS